MKPYVSLLGEVNADMARQLIDGLNSPPDNGDVAIEISTPGGDAEIGRRLMLEIDLARERLKPRRMLFLGKSHVYSAGVTFMSAFPRQDRYLAHDAVLLIHSRQLEKEVKLSGPISASLPLVRGLCNEIEMGIRLEEESFERLIEGSDIRMEELRRKALENWYVPAKEAWERGLVAGVL